MDKFLDKITSYNLLNNILPGAVTYYILKMLTHLNIPDFSILGEIFIYYFIGLLCSRIGSLIIEPICKTFKFVVYADYSDYSKAEEKDSKINILLEVNNMYRTFSASFFILILISVVNILKFHKISLNNLYLYGFIFVCFILFLFSYRKQTSYIVKKVKQNIN
ncbi:hypothetical protein [uncultured Brachyspira sp.]|uniref:hypothetical protein n=1 Tax=uncultured Brachyspira sp. TaxID=221953 RepID=UPI00261EBF71|nr:hypothetical protein [uncultured Brachyspira sp.]